MRVIDTYLSHINKFYTITIITMLIHWLRKRGGNQRFAGIFNAINQRCNNPNHKNYPLYWWRGIKNEWPDVLSFKNDMYPSYLEHVNKYWEKNTSIDRINPNWNYNKENCRWATQKEQLNNLRTNVVAIIDWKKYNAESIATLCNISIDAARGRIHKYNKWIISKDELFHIWSLEHPRVSVKIEWIIYTPSDIADLCGISKSSGNTRVHRYLKWEITKEELFYQWIKPVKDRRISEWKLKNKKFNFK